MDFKTLTLQIINDSSIIENSNEPLTISVFDLLLKGGFMMIPTVSYTHPRAHET